MELDTTNFMRLNWNQVGKGSVPWDPSSETGRILHIDATDSTTMNGKGSVLADNTAVTFIFDKINQEAFQTIHGTSPHWHTGVANGNGGLLYPATQGADLTDTVATTFLSATRAHTVYCALRCDDAAFGFDIPLDLIGLLSDGTNHFESRIHYDSDTGDGVNDIWILTKDGNNSNIPFPSMRIQVGGLTAGQITFFVWTYNGNNTGTNADHAFYYLGSSYSITTAGATGSVTVTNSTKSILGNQYYGYLFEGIVWDHALNATAISNLHSYARTKYGL